MNGRWNKNVFSRQYKHHNSNGIKEMFINFLGNGKAVAGIK
jgi:hypothetical protein